QQLVVLLVFVQFLVEWLHPDRGSDEVAGFGEFRGVGCDEVEGWSAGECDVECVVGCSGDGQGGEHFADGDGVWWGELVRGCGEFGQCAGWCADRSDDDDRGDGRGGGQRVAGAAGRGAQRGWTAHGHGGRRQQHDQYRAHPGRRGGRLVRRGDL